jgi:hypothetical protein
VPYPLCAKGCSFAARRRRTIGREHVKAQDESVQARKSKVHTLAAGIPPNDLFANALKVNAQPVWVHTASNQSASMEPGESALRHGGETNATASIWYTWSVRERTELLVDTAGSSFATAIGVYRGTSISTLVRVAAASSSIERRACLGSICCGTEYQLQDRDCRNSTCSPWFRHSAFRGQWSA